MQVTLEFIKFPEIHHKGYDLVWDTRQKERGVSEKIYISNFIDPEIQRQLRLRASRNKSIVFEGPDVVFKLGNDVSEALGQPSSQMTVIGVTGTNGKTSIVESLSWILSSLGKKVLQIGTLGVSIWGPDHAGKGERLQSFETGFTTPEAPSLHRLMRDALLNGVNLVVMEVSSHALELGRVAGVNFDAALFSNLSQDHLDFHENMENYALAKQKLFLDLLKNSKKQKKFYALASPDPLSLKFSEAVISQIPEIDHCLIKENNNFRIQKNSIQCLEFEFLGNNFRSQLVGAYNAWNLSLTIALAKYLGFGVDEIQKKLESFKGPIGRLQRVYANCFVDYAHTPDALENVLKTMKDFAGSESKVFCVMGCGGNRDKGKRPIMGELASRLSDSLWITNDNPRFEEPERIAQDILEGIHVSNKIKVKVELDRSLAIRKAMESMESKDLLLVAGKGHETYQIIKGTKNYFSDQEEILRFAQHSRALKN